MMDTDPFMAMFERRFRYHADGMLRCLILLGLLLVGGIAAAAFGYLRVLIIIATLAVVVGWVALEDWRQVRHAKRDAEELRQLRRTLGEHP